MYRNMAFLLIFTLLFVIAIQYSLNRKKMSFPVRGKITSKFGNRVHPITGATTFHNGVDIAVKSGTKITAPSSGLVYRVFSNEAGGNQLMISHDNGYISGYAHLSSTLVSPGERVTKGQTVALSGNTGKSTGPHLHLTIKDKKGNYIDPQKILT